jgi:hypothetical protein
MRKFNQLEKQIIKRLVSHPILAEEGMIRTSVFLEDNYIGQKHDLSMLIKSDEKLVIISGPQPREEFKEKIVLIITMFILFRDLREEGMLSIVGDSQNISGALGEQYKDGQSVKLTDDIARIIMEYFNNLIFISEEVRQFVNNDFRDQEQIRYREMMFVAVGALIVSVLLGLWGILKDVFN